MNQTYIDFNKISKALTKTIDVIQEESNVSEDVLQNLQIAHDEWAKAFSYSCSSKTKLE